ncbi:hypothetical protein GJU40_02030 [Bacillus lacus]|uniref:YprB ribonuclease H-like domain-containing protein n=1 Tax=Metabacillus lacus TaxID=1983721 RepID=A0A7X2IWK2_9BACI|nr:ribonuclease H-like domain-containing protein [Metabacillus lacus]MRX70945.1 hypothetical protein [Metabacillus lacus]
MSLKGKLSRYKSQMKLPQESPHPADAAIGNTTNIQYLKEWGHHDVKSVFHGEEYSLIREISYPLTYEHGLYCLGEFVNVVNEWNKSSSTHPLSAKGHTAGELFFFDTETTGLGGGTGNAIFLLGQARVQKNEVVVRQYLLPAPGNETALYHHFLSGINLKTLVTYNGKAFDWPQVKTRHTLVRDAVPALPEFGHFDLFHAARRMWKNNMDSVKLANVEKDILNIHRDADIPGYLAPMMYFQFLQSQHPENIAGVLKHNEIDVLSLITLYIHLSKKILLAEEVEDQQEQYELARWFQTAGDTPTALKIYESAAEKDGSNQYRAKMEAAMILKKSNEWERAEPMFNEVFQHSSGTSKIRAAIEMAKHLEHKKKMAAEALETASLAYAHLKEIEQFAKLHPSLKEDLQKRIKRLQLKVNK